MYKKIAVLRANALGDFIFSLPALIALRKTYPFAEIVLMGKKWHKEFLQNRPSPINRVIVIPKAAGVGEKNDYAKENKKELSLFFDSMTKEHFDLAIQMHGGGKYSNPFIKKIKASYTVGLQNRDAISLDKTLAYEYYQNEYSRYLEVVSLVEAKPITLTPLVQVTEKDLDYVHKKLPNFSKPFAVVHAGASDIRRRWDTKNFAFIADYLTEKGLPVVLNGIDTEAEIIADVMKNMKHPAINLCGKLSLSGLTGLLAKATLVVSNDTGPFHLSFALKTKTVGLFWCGNMINGAPLSRGNIRLLISWQTSCPICSADCVSVFPFEPQKKCTHSVSFLSGITTSDVLKKINELL